MACKKSKSDLNLSSAASTLAEELGIDIRSFGGGGHDDQVLTSGSGGAEHAPNGEASCSGYRKKVSIGSDDMTPKIKIRHLVARKMEEAWKTIPHFYVTIAVNMTDVVGMRHEHGASINDFVVAASARSLVQHPWVNATWNGEQAIELEPVNIAMAAATDRGLYYPVLHNCHQLGLNQISVQTRALAEKASVNGQLSEEETAGVKLL